jgi:Ca-activated chloride channel family protein
MIQFADPQVLWLLGGLPVLMVWYIWKNVSQQASLQISSIASLQFTGMSARVWMRHGLFLLRLIALAALVVALARPQITISKNIIATEGIDIMLTFDISGSMSNRDFIPSRLEAAKKVAEDFIDCRPNDRIGVIFFAAEAYAGCPITIDHEALKKIIANVKTGSLEDGTAIGLGIGTAVNRLKESFSKAKIIILMTDGENNAGSVKPLEAAQFAKSFSIKIYSIGILSPGSERQPMTQEDSTYAAIGNLSAEATLIQIAEMTGGKYFRATNEKKLAGIYEEINGLEKTRADMAIYKRFEERFYLFAIIATILLFSEMLLRYTIFKTMP